MSCQHLNLDQPDLQLNCWPCMDLEHLRGGELQVLFHLNFYLWGEELRCRCNDNFSCSSATQAAPDETAHAPKPTPESGLVIVQADVHRPEGEHDKGMQ